MATDVIIIGAGPYGLSLAAMLRGAGVEHRVFGTPMQTWRHAMPRGMFLKSEGFASNLYGPGDALTLGGYCTAHGLPYQPAGLPVPLDTFIAYGEAFQRAHVPGLETVDVARVGRLADGFQVETESGEVCRAGRVVVAAGITHFAHVPKPLADLPDDLVGHASRYAAPAVFAGKRVAVVGAGASATDYAVLLAEAGADVHIISRAPDIAFLGPPSTERRTWLDELRAPQSGLGPGWRSRLATDAPLLFHMMPESFRKYVVRRHLGPSGGWWTKEPLQRLTTLHASCSISSAEARGDGVMLSLAGDGGKTETLAVDHVIAATGYQPDVARLPFLTPQLRAVATESGAPKLSANFESGIPGLYFIGLASAYAFGPLVRFAFGADFTATRLSRHLGRRSVKPVGAEREATASQLPPRTAAGPA